VPAKEYLDKCYVTYVKLFENSNVLHKKIHDKLMSIGPSKEGGGGGGGELSPLKIESV